VSPRYAIYLAPPPDSALWRFGSTVLGYDALTGHGLPGFTAARYSTLGWMALTERPRTYGFHATLKAPFRLAEGSSPQLLHSAAAAFCAERAPFDLGPMRVDCIAKAGVGFVALTAQRPSPELIELEADAVRFFDRFRAPAGAEEIAARKPGMLSERQRENLAAWGYPYVGDDYRFHMTLTGEIMNPYDAADALADLYARDVGSAHLIVDAVVLFEQRTPQSQFRILERFPFGKGGSLHVPRQGTSLTIDQGASARTETA
jgi:2'-5' RNA ligase